MQPSCQLDELRESLTSWKEEFGTLEKKAGPSFQVEIVSQEKFDFYDAKAPFGILPGECEDGMFKSERKWLAGEFRSTLEVHFKEDLDGDFFLPGTTGFRRSETVVLYSLRACERVREIITAIQQILCEARHDWIVYLQGLPSEDAEVECLPEKIQDFTVWVYRDKIVATAENAAIIQELIESEI